jgi:hypothetical protein
MGKYPPRWLDVAEERGWDRKAHAAALESGDDDAIMRTHPTNWLAVSEVGDWSEEMDDLLERGS